MSGTEESLQELRGYWEFAAVCQFLHLFHGGLKVDSFETEELERQLMSSPTDSKLIELHIQLLKSLVGPLNARLINTETWQTYLDKEFSKRVVDTNPLLEDVEYMNLPLRNKVVIIHCLCEWQFDNAERLRAFLKSEEEIEWRIEPVGYDAKGNTYWLFDDNRLYREAPATLGGKARGPKKGKSKAGKLDPSWTLECATIQDWESFPEKFRKSRSVVEKEFYQFLTEDALPKLLADLQEKEKQKRFEEAMNNRKRSSRLQMKEIEKMEQERQEQLFRQQHTQVSLRQQNLDKRQRAELERQRRIEAREQRLAERARLSHPAPDETRPFPTLDEVAAAQSKAGPMRSSSRQKRKRQQEEEKWYFDCVCGVHGENLDDGTPMLACGKCNVWQHIGCLAKAHGESVGDADIQKWEALDFVCSSCRHRDDSVPASEEESVRSSSVISHAQEIDVESEFDEQHPAKRRREMINGMPFTTTSGTSTMQTGVSMSQISSGAHQAVRVAATPAAATPVPFSDVSPIAFGQMGLPPALGSSLGMLGQTPPVALPHPASPAYYQYAPTAVLSNGFSDGSEALPAGSPPTSNGDTSQAAAFLASLAAGFKPKAGPAAVESFPSPVSLVPSQQQEAGVGMTMLATGTIPVPRSGAQPYVGGNVDGEEM